MHGRCAWLIVRAFASHYKGWRRWASRLARYSIHWLPPALLSSRVTSVLFPHSGGTIGFPTSPWMRSQPALPMQRPLVSDGSQSMKKQAYSLEEILRHCLALARRHPIALLAVVREERPLIPPCPCQSIIVPCQCYYHQQPPSTRPDTLLNSSFDIDEAKDRERAEAITTKNNVASGNDSI